MKVKASEKLWKESYLDIRTILALEKHGIKTFGDL